MTVHDPILFVDAFTLQTKTMTNDEDFNRFYRGEGNRLARALALALGDADLANEAIDEGMARAYQRWGKVSRYDSPAGWVYRISMNWARNRIRNRKREVLTDEIKDGFNKVGPELDVDLEAALNALSLEARSVVIMRYLLDWSIADTAQALDVAPGTVKSRLSRALEQLEAILENQQ